MSNQTQYGDLPALEVAHAPHCVWAAMSIHPTVRCRGVIRRAHNCVRCLKCLFQSKNDRTAAVNVQSMRKYGQNVYKNRVKWSAFIAPIETLHAWIAPRCMHGSQHQQRCMHGSQPLMHHRLHWQPRASRTSSRHKLELAYSEEQIEMNTCSESE